MVSTEMGSIHEGYTEDCEVDYQECFHDPRILHTELPAHPSKPHKLNKHTSQGLTNHVFVLLA